MHMRIHEAVFTPVQCVRGHSQPFNSLENIYKLILILCTKCDDIFQTKYAPNNHFITKHTLMCPSTTQTGRTAKQYFKGIKGKFSYLVRI